VTRRPNRQPAVLPLLDRLIDEEPFKSADPPTAFAHDDRAIEKAVRDVVGRDLEVLLNTRQRLTKPLEGAREGFRSILDFGLPAARGTNLATPAGRKDLARAIEAAIECYEPRLRGVHVSVEPGGTPLDPLKLTIDATLAVGSDAAPMHVEASLAARSGRVSLQEGGR
jgi:type VI secretion system lysozyme-like protein